MNEANSRNGFECRPLRNSAQASASPRLLHHRLCYRRLSGVAVMTHSYGARHQARLQAEPARNTDRIARKGHFEPGARSGKPVHCGSLKPLVARTAHHAGVLLIGHDKKDVRRLKFLRTILCRCHPAKHHRPSINPAAEAAVVVINSRLLILFSKI